MGDMGWMSCDGFVMMGGYSTCTPVGFGCGLSNGCDETKGCVSDGDECGDITSSATLRTNCLSCPPNLVTGVSNACATFFNGDDGAWMDAGVGGLLFFSSKALLS